MGQMHVVNFVQMLLERLVIASTIPVRLYPAHVHFVRPRPAASACASGDLPLPCADDSLTTPCSPHALPRLLVQNDGIPPKHFK